MSCLLEKYCNPQSKFRKTNAFSKLIIKIAAVFQFFAACQRPRLMASRQAIHSSALMSNIVTF